MTDTLGYQLLEWAFHNIGPWVALVFGGFTVLVVLGVIVAFFIAAFHDAVMWLTNKSDTKRML